MIQFRILRVTERGLRFEYACILHFSQPGIPYIYTKVGFRKWKTKHTTRIFIAVPRLIHLWIVPLPNKFLHTSVTQHLRMSFIHCKDLPDATPLCLSRHVFRLLTVTTIPAQDTHASGHHISHLRSRGSPLLYLFVSFAWVSFTFLFALSHLGTHNSHFYLYICFLFNLFPSSAYCPSPKILHFLTVLISCLPWEGILRVGRPLCDEIRLGFGSKKGSC